MKSRGNNLLLIWIGVLVFAGVTYFFSTSSYSSQSSLLSRQGKGVTRRSTKSTRKVILHIGPHKTGSTHIHTYLDKISDQLSSFDYCWPVPRGNIMNSNMLAIHFISNRTVHNISVDWLDNCLNSSPNIILSAEAFDRFSLQNFMDFHQYITNNTKNTFEFEIVIIYREWLNHMYSLYTEIHKHASRGTSFSDYLFKNLDLLEEIPILNMTRLITSYEPIVGLKNIHLLDYYDIIAAGKDEAYVLVCEIMGILCKESEYLNVQKVKENEKPDMIASELFQLVRNQALALGCKIANEKRDFMTEFIGYYRDVNLTVPLASSNMKLLHPHAAELDIGVRKRYSSIIMYGNHSANVEALQRVNITEINLLGFYSDENCLNWLINEVQAQIKQQRFYGCKRDIITKEEVLGNANSHNSNPNYNLIRAKPAPKPRPAATASNPAPPASLSERRNATERLIHVKKKLSESISTRR